MAGRLIERTDWNEGKINYDYDKGLLRHIRYQNGCEEHFRYDANENVIEWTRKNGDVISYQYDCLDRVRTIGNKSGVIKSFEYDAVGNVVCMTDASGNATRYEYSPMGDIVQVTNADGSGMRYEYDDVGQLLFIHRLNGKDENGIRNMVKVYSYEYDLNGQVRTVTDALGNQEHYQYNELGQLQCKVDREGYETRYTYGKNGQTSEIAYGDGKRVKMSYTPLRQLAEMEDWLGKTKLIRNEDNRLEKVIDYNGQTVSYQYGNRGERNAIVYPDDSKAVYEYDDFMRLKRLSFGEEDIRYQYEKDKLVRKYYSNGAESLYQYDYADRINSIVHRKDGAEIESYRYQYDKNGNRCEEIRIRGGAPQDSGRYRYEYNVLNRLTGVYHNDKQIRAYEYDGFGNRIRKWENGQETLYSYNEANQLLHERALEESIRYRYDLRGNLTEIERNGIEERRYEFNAMNQLERAADREGRTAQYIYNGQGHRVGKTISGRETRNIRYAVDQTKGYHNRLWEEEDGKVSKYIWGEDIACIEKKGQSSFILTNVMGTPTRTMDRLGHTGEIFAADEYGAMERLKGDKDIAIGFVGFMADDISGTLYAQAREYMPQLGRFISEDRIGGDLFLSASFNQYDYCWGNPLIFVDITGLYPEWLEHLIEGGKAHKSIEAYAIVAGMNKGGGVVHNEVIISGGLEEGKTPYYTKSGKGRVDIVYINTEGDAEVYEIKPNSASGRATGPSQLASYIYALDNSKNERIKYKYDEVMTGHNLDEYFDGAIVNDIFNSSVYYKLTMEENYPGIIFYEKIQKKPRPEEVLEKVLSTVTAGIPEEKMQTVEAIGWAVASFFCFKAGGAMLINDLLGPAAVIDDVFAVAFLMLSVYCMSRCLQNILSCG